MNPEVAARTDETASSSAHVLRAAAPRQLNTAPTLAPPRWSELLAIVLLVVLADVTIYRGYGFSGYAVLFMVAPLLLLLGSAQKRTRLLSPTLVIWLMLFACAAKAIWCGNALLLLNGPVLLFAFAMTLTGFPPFLLELVVFCSLTIPAGYRSLLHYARSHRQLAALLPRSSWMNVVVPAAVLVMFSLLFVFANPDLLSFLGARVQLVTATLRAWFVDYSPRPVELLFWLCIAWLASGLLRPYFDASTMLVSESTDVAGVKKERAAAYPVCRNTLLAVNVLFAIYLVFELKTLWFRVFPQGFYYSGYAHEGAAWLTAALALATAILSVVFSGDILRDPRLQQLRQLAWIWSVQNLLLAAAVYHRLLIYVGFNGMSYMRVVGFFGMTAVVAGFLLVVSKIAWQKNFVWLFRRQLWALGMTVFLFSITPVDWLVTKYNVSRIMSGDSAPVVQISVHEISPEGLLLLSRLLESPDPQIRTGIRALLASHQIAAESRAQRRRAHGWTAWQMADERLRQQLAEHQDQWREFRDSEQREPALDAFHKYAYQWY